MKKIVRIVWNNFRVFILIALTMLILIYLFRFDFSKRISYQVSSMITDHLADISSQSVNALDRELNRVQAEVCYTAEYLSQNPGITEKEKHLLYNQLREKCGFANIRLVSEDGKLYSSDYQLLPESVGGYVEAIGRGESGMTDIFPSSVTGKEVFGFYAPVRRDGRLCGGIAGIMIVDQMIDIIATSGFNSGSYNYILTSDGSVISQTSHKNSLYEGRDYLSFLRSEVTDGEKTAKNLHMNMRKGERGVFFYEAGTESRIAYYEPAHYSDWYVVTIVSTEVTEDYIGHINRTAIYLTVKIVILFLILAILIIIWSYHTKKIILHAKEEIELEKTKLELALRYSTNTILEYKIKKDSLSFITPPVIRGKSFPHTIENMTVNTASQGIVSAEYFSTVLHAIKNSWAEEMQEPVEFPGGAAFEEEIWFKLTCSPVRDGKGEIIESIVTIEDITEEKNIRKRFAQEEQYRAALLSEAVAMWSIDLIKQEVIACTLAGKNVMDTKNVIFYDRSFAKKLLQRVHEEERDRVETMTHVSNMLASYYTGTRELKDLFRIRYSGASDFKWVTCTISLLTEPTSGNPIAFAYIRDVDEETRRKMELSYSSERDPLTGLYNRRNIAEKIDRALQKEGSLSCLMMLDLDGFKGINDKYGHQTGDLLLKEIAQILASSFRADDLVTRLGGDEFLVFLTDLPNCESARSRAEKVRQLVFRLVRDDIRYNVSISIGLAFAPKDGRCFTKLYQCADEALYGAKRKGKNRICLYEQETARKP